MIVCIDRCISLAMYGFALRLGYPLRSVMCIHADSAESLSPAVVASKQFANVLLHLNKAVPKKMEVRNHL